ncbi:hypothetical protein Trydic_g21641 [Trypoxylus dichotomus]
MDRHRSLASFLFQPEYDLHPFGYHTLKPPVDHDGNIIGESLRVESRLRKCGQQVIHQQTPERRGNPHGERWFDSTSLQNPFHRQEGGTVKGLLNVQKSSQSTLKRPGAQFVLRRHGEAYHPDYTVPTVKFGGSIMVWDACRQPASENSSCAWAA